MRAFIRALPKAELHLHFEGTITPTDVFVMAERNERKHFVSHADVEAAEQARRFDTLGEFLTEIRAACSVAMTEDDYYLIARTYLRTARIHNNVRYAELQFGPQEHSSRGVSLHTLLKGLRRAMVEAEAELGIASNLIIDLLKDAPVDDSVACLKSILALEGGPAAWGIVAVGLAGAEIGYPPSLFKPVMDLAHAAGLRVITHAGEEGGPDIVRESLDVLRVQRIDHGVRSLEDAELCARLVKEGIGLCVCPLSNHKLQIYKRFFGGRNPLRELMAAGLTVCLNSDDPSFFLDDPIVTGGDVEEGAREDAEGLPDGGKDLKGHLCANFERAVADCGLSKLEVWQLARNSFLLAFGLTEEQRAAALAELDALKPTE